MAPVVLFLALVLATSAAHKALSPARLAAAAARLAGAPVPLGHVLLAAAGALEAAAAVCLLIPEATLGGAAIAAALWSAYALALWWRRGEVLDCGCDLIDRPRAVGAGQIARAALLAALALGVLPGAMLSPAAFALSPEAALPALGLLALYLGASEILAIPRPAWRRS